MRSLCLSSLFLPTNYTFFVINFSFSLRNSSFFLSLSSCWSTLSSASFFLNFFKSYLSSIILSTFSVISLSFLSCIWSQMNCRRSCLSFFWNWYFLVNREPMPLETYASMWLYCSEDLVDPSSLTVWAWLLPPVLDLPPWRLSDSKSCAVRPSSLALEGPQGFYSKISSPFLTKGF